MSVVSNSRFSVDHVGEGGSESLTPIILNFGTRWGEQSASHQSCCSTSIH